MRHGPRTPVDTYPNDPYLKSKFEPIGWGHITNVSINEQIISLKYPNQPNPFRKVNVNFTSSVFY